MKTSTKPSPEAGVASPRNLDKPPLNACQPCKTKLKGAGPWAPGCLEKGREGK